MRQLHRFSIDLEPDNISAPEKPFSGIFNLALTHADKRIYLLIDEAVFNDECKNERALLDLALSSNGRIHVVMFSPERIVSHNRSTELLPGAPVLKLPTFTRDETIQFAANCMKVCKGQLEPGAGASLYGFSGGFPVFARSLMHKAMDYWLRLGANAPFGDKHLDQAVLLSKIVIQNNSLNTLNRLITSADYHTLVRDPLELLSVVNSSRRAEFISNEELLVLAHVAVGMATPFPLIPHTERLVQAGVLDVLQERPGFKFHAGYSQELFFNWVMPVLKEQNLLPPNIETYFL